MRTSLSLSNVKSQKNSFIEKTFFGWFSILKAKAKAAGEVQESEKQLSYCLFFHFSPSQQQHQLQYSQEG